MKAKSAFRKDSTEKDYSMCFEFTDVNTIANNFINKLIDTGKGFMKNCTSIKLCIKKICFRANNSTRRLQL